MIYFDCPRGVSGDMLLGALLDINKDKDNLKMALVRAGFKKLKIDLRDKKIDGISGTAIKFITGREPLPNYGSVKDLLENIKTAKTIKNNIEKTYDIIFKAEAKVHNCKPEKVHLHELSSFDTFISIFSFYILTKGLDIYCSALPVGSGTAPTAHGPVPLPAPATAEILKYIPVSFTGIGEELTTPTGAALLKNSAKFSAPDLVIKKTGYGIGQRNFLRVFKADKIYSGALDILRAEVNIDDMTGEDTANLMARLREFSREVYCVPAFMKKGRPGIVITALVEENKLESFRDSLFLNSTAVGFRYFKVARDVLKREIINFKSSYGKVRIKISGYKDKKNIKPEYDDIAKISKETGLPVSNLRKNIIKEYINE